MHVRMRKSGRLVRCARAHKKKRMCTNASIRAGYVASSKANVHYTYIRNAANIQFHMYVSEHVIFFCENAFF